MRLSKEKALHNYVTLNTTSMAATKKGLRWWSTASSAKEVGVNACVGMEGLGGGGL